MGTSLTDYVNHYRIEHAQTLLANTDVPIKDIALRCGIGDIHYFTRLFKKISGVTPKAWRASTSCKRGVLALYALPDTCKLGLTEAQAYAVVWDAFQKIQEEAPRAMVYYRPGNRSDNYRRCR